MSETEKYFGLIGPHASVVVVVSATLSCFDAILGNVHKNSEMETRPQSSPAAAAVSLKRNRKRCALRASACFLTLAVGFQSSPTEVIISLFLFFNYCQPDQSGVY